MYNELMPEKEVIKQICGGRLPSESAIWNLRRKGQLPPSIKIGRGRFCDPQVVEQWVNSRMGQ